MSNYYKNLIHYERKELVLIQPFLQYIAMSSSLSSKYPVFKVLKAIFKLFQLNLLQTVFLAHLVKQTKWQIKQKIIMESTSTVTDIVCYCPQSQQYKSLILYLMLLGQTVKFYLNQSTQSVLHEAVKLCSNFQQIFTLWSKKHSNLTKQISLKSLNEMYMRLYEFTRFDTIDFNTLVDVILQISPPYMPQKKQKSQQAEDRKKPTKKIKPNEAQPSLQKKNQEGNKQIVKAQSQNTCNAQRGVKIEAIDQILHKLNPNYQDSYQIDLFDMIVQQKTTL